MRRPCTASKRGPLLAATRESPRHRGVSPLPGGSEAGEEGLGSGPTPGRGPPVLGPTDPRGALGRMPLLMPEEEARLTGRVWGAGGCSRVCTLSWGSPCFFLLFLLFLPLEGREQPWQHRQESGGRSCARSQGPVPPGLPWRPWWPLGDADGVPGSRPGVAGRRRRPFLPTSGSPPQSRGPFFSLRGSRHPRQLGSSKAVDAVPGGEATVSPDRKSVV